MALFATVGRKLCPPSRIYSKSNSDRRGDGPASFGAFYLGFRRAALKPFLHQQIGKLADRPPLAFRNPVQLRFLLRIHTD